MYKQVSAYFSKHPTYNGITHLLIGVGLGVLLTYPFFGVHPVRWGVGLIALGFLAHLYPLTLKKSRGK